VFRDRVNQTRACWGGVCLFGAVVASLGVLASLGAGLATAAGPAFIAPLTTTDTLASTVPANGDQNPYGIVTAPTTVGKLHRGDILVSNFNSQGPTSLGVPTTGGMQGEGTTIVQFDADGGHPRLFAQIPTAGFPDGVGLTTALSALPDGYVIVGSMPTTDGTFATATAGGLIVLDPTGQVVGTIDGGPINGPWDMTQTSLGSQTWLFVTNVLNGTVAASPNVVDGGTVVRIRLVAVAGRAPRVIDERVIATGFPERTDPGAVVVGPTGVAIDRHGTVYVADSVANRIARIPDGLGRASAVTGGGQTLSAGGALNDPLGLTLAPNGDILTANGADGTLLETTPAGVQVASKVIDDGNGTGAGDLFGLTVPADGSGVLFVDDFDNTLRVLH
jgi:hypothetical protein